MDGRIKKFLSWHRASFLCRYGYLRSEQPLSHPAVTIEYRLISKKGEGTFSEVLKAQSTKTNKYVAIKCMKAHFYNID